MLSSTRDTDDPREAAVAQPSAPAVAPAPVTSPEHATALQRTIGNAALSRLLQRAPEPAATQTNSDARISELEAGAMRQASQQRATLHLNGFRDDVMKRVTGWERAILSVGSAYTKAAKNHTDAIEAQTKLDAITSQIMFSVLSAASAGGLSWMSGTMQAAKGAADADLLTTALEDVLQSSVSELVSGNMPGIVQRVATPAQTAVSTEPLVYQNERMDRLKASQQLAYTAFKGFNDALLNMPAEGWDRYDEDKQVAEYNTWLAQADMLKAADDLPSVDEMERELERGFWAKWAPALQTLETVLMGNEPHEQAAFTSPGAAIEARLTAVGITKDSGVEDFGWWTSINEIKKVLSWASRYKVEPFIP